MSILYPHTATSIFFSCIDDRLINPDTEFIKAHGNAFHPRLAGGGAAFLDVDERKVAIKQIVAAYKIAEVTEVYLQSHTDCGAYRLMGLTFNSTEAEVARLYDDLESAAMYVRAALAEAGADPDSITVHVRVIDPAGTLQETAGMLA